MTASPASAEPELTPANREALQAVFDTTPLFDPLGARWVRATVIVRSIRGREYEQEREGWQLTLGGQAWLVLDDQSRARVAPTARAPVEADFTERMRELMGIGRARNLDPTLGRGRAPRKSKYDLSQQEASLMVCRAAWALRLSHDDLAEELLTLVRRLTPAERPSTRSDVKPRPARALLQHVQRSLAWAAFAEAALALDAGAKEELLDAVARLEPLVAHADTFGPAAALITDVRRRQREGSLRTQLPADLESRPIEERVTLLVTSLQDVRAPGGWFEPHDDPRTRALVELGEPAVPALLACAERDERLTRVVRMGDVWAGNGDRLWKCALTPVSAVAQETLRAILLLDRRWRPTAPFVDQAREYLDRHPGATTEERLRRALVEPGSPVLRLAAAHRLAELQRTAGGVDGAGPTAAEAVLTGMDAELEANHGAVESERRELEADFLQVLASLGDRRIVPALRARFERAGDWPRRIELARACHALGDSAPLDALAAEVTAHGPPSDVRLRWTLPRAVDYDALDRLVEVLGQTGRPEHDAALFSLADPESPLHQLALRGVLNGVRAGDATSLRSHPFCLRVLRTAIKGDLAARTLSQLLVGARPVASPQATEFARRFVDRARRIHWVERAMLGGGSFIPDLLPLGRPATAADVEAGRALFHQDGRGRLADLRLPAVAEVVSSSGTPVRAIVMQAEVTPEGRLRYGAFSLEHAGPLDEDAVSACWPLPSTAEADDASRRLAMAVSTGDVAEALRFARTDAQREWLATITTTKDYFLADDDPVRWARQVLRPQPDGSWGVGE